MNLFETLKQLKNIRADALYAEKSRRVVLASPQREPLGARQIFVRIFETAGSLALAGALIFVIAGGLSGSRYLSPVSFTGVDPMALRAEAQAIDMQINIANLSYAQSSNGAGSTAMMAPPAHGGSSTPVAAGGTVTTPGITVQEPTSTASSTASSTTPATASSTASSTTFSINEALQQLEQ